MMSNWKMTEKVLPPLDAPITVAWEDGEVASAVFDGRQWFVTGVDRDDIPTRWRMTEGATRSAFWSGALKSAPITSAPLLFALVALFAGQPLMGVLLLAIAVGGASLFGMGNAFNTWSQSRANSKGGAIGIATIVMIITAFPALYAVYWIVAYVFGF